MKRDASLIPLSHQHHNGLALGVMVKRALDADGSDENLQRQRLRIVDRFEVELVNHFAMEEELLFPLAVDRELVDRLIGEHRQMEEMVAAIRIAASRAELERFLDLLSTHIRREESDLFEQAQREISREELDRIGREIDRRAVRVCL